MNWYYTEHWWQSNLQGNLNKFSKKPYPPAAFPQQSTHGLL
jgi:hypothetical protein